MAELHVSAREYYTTSIPPLSVEVESSAHPNELLKEPISLAIAWDRGGYGSPAIGTLTRVQVASLFQVLKENPPLTGAHQVGTIPYVANTQNPLGGMVTDFDYALEHYLEGTFGPLFLHLTCAHLAIMQAADMLDAEATPGNKKILYLLSAGIDGEGGDYFGIGMRYVTLNYPDILTYAFADAGTTAYGPMPNPSLYYNGATWEPYYWSGTSSGLTGEELRNKQRYWIQTPNWKPCTHIETRTAADDGTVELTWRE